jgi:hypothetical protein
VKPAAAATRWLAALSASMRSSTMLALQFVQQPAGGQPGGLVA